MCVPGPGCIPDPANHGISAFVAELTGSTIWVGGLSIVNTVAGALPGLFVARWIEPKPRKMPYLMTAIYLRVVSWGTLAFLVFTLGADRPITLAWILVGMLVIICAGGGMGNVPYTDIIGKIVPPDRRGAFFGGKGLLAGPLSMGAALSARQILKHVPYPNNYALLFGSAVVGLAVASIGFWVIKEPPGPVDNQPPPAWHTYWKKLTAASRRLKTLIITQVLTGFSLMALPFYVVYARQELDAPLDAAGWFLTAQVLGGVLSNLLWARLVDRAGSRRMLVFCAGTSTITPLLAVFLGRFGWPAFFPSFSWPGLPSTDGRLDFKAPCWNWRRQLNAPHMPA